MPNPANPARIKIPKGVTVHSGKQQLLPPHPMTQEKKKRGSK